METTEFRVKVGGIYIEIEVISGYVYANYNHQRSFVAGFVSNPHEVFTIDLAEVIRALKSGSCIGKRLLFCPPGENMVFPRKRGTSVVANTMIPTDEVTEVWALVARLSS